MEKCPIIEFQFMEKTREKLMQYIECSIIEFQLNWKHQNLTKELDELAKGEDK